MRNWSWALALCASAPLAFTATGTDAQSRPATEIAPVVVVGVTPLGGEIDVDKIAAPIQTAHAADIERSHALDLSAFMTRELGGVYVKHLRSFGTFAQKGSYFQFFT